MTPSKWLVLGLGNPLAGADGFGPAVVEHLAGRGLSPQVELVDAHADLLAHLDRFSGYDAVILVDAVLAERAGGVAVFDEETFSSWDDRSTGVHGMSALMAVKVFRRLQRAVPDGSLPPPRIHLVAHLVTEHDFARPPHHTVVRTAAHLILAAVNEDTAPAA